MRGMATLPQGNQELLVVKNKVARPPGELGVSKSMECDIFQFSALTLLASTFRLPHLFRGAGHEERRGEQLKWSLAFRLYIGSFACAQLSGPVHTARLGRVCFYI